MKSPKKIINELLVEVFNQILNIESEALNKRGVLLSMSEVHVLEAIENASQPTMGDVAKKLRITLGTLTTAISVLVKKGYVSRYREEDDRRKVYLSLNESAVKVLKSHEEFHDDMIDSLFRDLKLDSDIVLLNALENINKYFKNKY